MVLIQTFVKSIYIFIFYMDSSGFKRLFQRDMNLSSNLFLMQVSNEDVLKYFDFLEIEEKMLLYASQLLLLGVTA